LFFSTQMGLYTMTLFLLTLWSTLTFTVTFWDAWEEMYDKNDRKFGATTTGSITTMRPPTHPWKPQSLWQATTWLSFPILPTRRTVKGRPFETVSDIQRESQTVLNSIKENDFHGALEECKKWWDRRIHSQGDYFAGDSSQHFNKLSQHFFFELVRKLSDVRILMPWLGLELCKAWCRNHRILSLTLRTCSKTT
jgi:hypothetical protein